MVKKTTERRVKASKSTVQSSTPTFKPVKTMPGPKQARPASPPTLVSQLLARVRSLTPGKAYQTTCGHYADAKRVADLLRKHRKQGHVKFKEVAVRGSSMYVHR